MPNYIKVKTPFNRDLINQLKLVTLKELDADGSVMVESYSAEISSMA